MKHSSHRSVPTPRDRLAPRKPGAWLMAILILTIAGLLWWRDAGQNPRTNALLRSAVTSDSDEPLVTGTRAEIIESASPATTSDSTELPITALIRQLNADGATKESRQRAALALANDGSESAMRALNEALAAGAPEFQEFVAAALGQSTNMESGILLEGLLKNTNETVALSASRSLSKQGSPFAVASLSQLLYDEGRSVNVRAEAALGLGAIDRPDALAALVTAVMQIQDEAVASQIIRGIAGRQLNETQQFLQAFLDAPHVSAELKAEALEGLSQAKGDATPLLLNYSQSNDPELRAAAALALSTSDTRGAAGAEIIALLKDETDPLVRKRLYRALANQENFDFNAAWAQTANETDPAARIAGMDVLARAAQQSPSPQLTALFDEYALPELKNLALNGGTRDEQLASVIVLRRLQTANATAALREIAARTSDTGIATATGTPTPRTRQ